MGTLGGGLRLLRNGRVFSYYLHDGLFDNEIYGITADADDRLWMACSKGIFMVPRADLLKHADGLLKRFESRPYSPMDGLRTIECNAGVQPVRLYDERWTVVVFHDARPACLGRGTRAAPAVPSADCDRRHPGERTRGRPPEIS